MKKLGIGIAAAVAIVVVGGLGTSYVMGGKVQEGFEATAKEWSKQPLTVKVVSYERGLLSSKAQTEWTVASGSDTLRFVAKHDISHGPLPHGHAAEVVSTFLLNDDASPEWKAAYKDQAPLVWRSTVGWSQASKHEITSPAFAGEFDGAKVAFGGAKAQFDMTSDLKGMKGTADFPTLQVDNPEEQSNMALAGGAMRFDLHQPKDQEFVVGPFAMSLASLKVTSSAEAGGKPSTIEDLVMDTDTQLVGEVVNVAINTKIKSFTSPDFKATELAMDMAMRNMDAGVMNNIAKLGQQANLEAMDPQALLMQSLQQLLARKPEIEIKRMAMRTDDGVSEVSGSLAYVGNPAQAINPAMDVKGAVNLNLPKPVMLSLFTSRVRDSYLEQMDEDSEDAATPELMEAVKADVQERLTSLVQAGLLIDTNTAYTAKLNYGGGKFEANDKPLDQNGLMTLMTAMP